MALLKLVPREGVDVQSVRIDKENVGQLASLLVAALTSKSTRFRTRSTELADALRVGTTWSNDAVLVGIQDFIILSETGAKVQKPVHLDLLLEVCLSKSTLSEMDDVSLTMTIAHYTRLVLAAAYHESSVGEVSSRQFVKSIIDDAIPLIFIKGVMNNV